MACSTLPLDQLLTGSPNNLFLTYHAIPTTATVDLPKSVEQDLTPLHPLVTTNTFASFYSLKRNPVEVTSLFLGNCLHISEITIFVTN